MRSLRLQDRKGAVLLLSTLVAGLIISVVAVLQLSLLAVPAAAQAAPAFSLTDLGTAGVKPTPSYSGTELQADNTVALARQLNPGISQGLFLNWTARQKVLEKLSTDTFSAPFGTDVYHWPLSSPSVIDTGTVGADRYRMWYTSYDAHNHWNVAYATSPDGLTWSKKGLVLNSTPDIAGRTSDWRNYISTVRVMRDSGGTYRMTFTAYGNDNYFRIGYATSTDGITWSNVKIIFGTSWQTTSTSEISWTGSTNWVNRHAGSPSAMVQVGTTWYMWFIEYDRVGLYLATATSPEGPWSVVTSPGTTTPQKLDNTGGFTFTWENGGLSDFNVIYDSAAAKFRAWYTGLTTYPSSNWHYEIGYVDSTDGKAWGNKQLAYIVGLGPWNSQPYSYGLLIYYPPPFDYGKVGAPSIIIDSTTKKIKMWYGARSTHAVWYNCDCWSGGWQYPYYDSIGYAESPLYASTGTFESGVLDAGFVADWKSISWTATVPQLTKVVNGNFDLGTTEGWSITAPTQLLKFDALSRPDVIGQYSMLMQSGDSMTQSNIAVPANTWLKIRFQHRLSGQCVAPGTGAVAAQGPIEVSINGVVVSRQTPTLYPCNNPPVDYNFAWYSGSATSIDLKIRQATNFPLLFDAFVIEEPVKFPYVPYGSSVKMQTRTGNTATPDATWSAWSTQYTNPLGNQITIANPQNPGRYIQYRATLATDDQNAITPVLSSVKVAYDRYCAPIDDTVLDNSFTLCAGTYNIADAAGDGVIKLATPAAGVLNPVLDCAGATIIGSGTGKGIVITGGSWTVRNCNLKGYSTGIDVNAPATVTANSVTGGTVGINIVSAAAGSSIINNKIVDSNTGIKYVGSTTTGATITDNKIERATSGFTTGIEITSSAATSTVGNNNVTNAVGNAFKATFSSIALTNNFFCFSSLKDMSIATTTITSISGNKCDTSEGFAAGTTACASACVPDTTPPGITALGPTGTLSPGTTTTTLTLTTNEAAECRFSTTPTPAGQDAATRFAAMTLFSSTSSISHSHALSGLKAGTFTYYIRCKDFATPTANIMQSDTAINFGIGTLPAPVMSDAKPVSGSTLTSTTSTLLELTTDINATCAYSTTAGAGFSAMTVFANTSDFAATPQKLFTLHNTTVTVTPGTTQNFYVKCKNADDIVTADLPINFTVASPGQTTSSPPDISSPTVSKVFPLVGDDVKFSATAASGVGLKSFIFSWTPLGDGVFINDTELPITETSVPIAVIKKIPVQAAGKAINWTFWVSDTQNQLTALPTQSFAVSLGQSAQLGNIQAGVPNSTNITLPDLSLTNITITTTATATGVSLEITKLAPADVASTAQLISGPVLTYLDLKKFNLTDAQIQSAKIAFNVSRDWVAAKLVQLPTVALQRWDGTKWTALPTTKIGEDAVSFFFEATTTALSLFAVAGVSTDTTPPIVTITAPKNGAVFETGNFTLVYTVSETPSFCMYSLNNINTSIPGCTPVIFGSGLTPPVPQGNNTLAVFATDAIGNLGGSATISISVTQSTPYTPPSPLAPAPAVNVTAPPPAAKLRLPVTTWTPAGTIGQTIKQSFAINNDGNALLTVTSVTPGGDLASQIKLTNVPTSVSPLGVASFDATLDLTGVTEGTRTGTITVTTNGGTDTISVTAEVRIEILPAVAELERTLTSLNAVQALRALPKDLAAPLLGKPEEATKLLQDARSASTAGRYAEAREAVRRAEQLVNDLRTQLPDLQALARERAGNFFMIVVLVGAVGSGGAVGILFVLRRRHKAAPMHCAICGKTAATYHTCSQCGRQMDAQCIRSYQDKLYCIDDLAKMGLIHKEPAA